MVRSITDKKKKDSPNKKNYAFPVVALGASAGGLQAITEVLTNLPANTGMAYIFVQHLDPDHKSFLTSILARKTKMKVQEIENMEHMEPNNLYVIPSNKEIKVTNGHIQLLPRPKTSRTNLSIDILFESLADTHGANVIGIVLSGNASDGMKGLKAIKKAGGLTMAQDASAQSDSMPNSAIASGAVDFILSPKEIARKLTRIGKNGLPLIKKKNPKKTVPVTEMPEFGELFVILLNKKGADFSHYKLTTIQRRVSNRMVQCGIDNLTSYIEYLKDNGTEVDALYKDLLINVTSFFRDNETFRYLKNTFFPKLLKSKLPVGKLRVWVPASSYGQEAYSIAMILTEIQDNEEEKIPFQIFATDLSEMAIHDARAGKYSATEITSLDPKRLKRFFVKSGDHYTITKEIRELCVFAPHNLLSDPPFFRMDFISCRNLLIYFNIAAQKKALSIMHFALNDGRFLMLGKSETTGPAHALFTQVNPKHRIYSRKKISGARKMPDLGPRLMPGHPISKEIKMVSRRNQVPDALILDGAIDNILLKNYMPACAIINNDMDILQFRGTTGFFLEHQQGKASLNILKMVRADLAFDLRTSIMQVIRSGLAARKKDIEISNGKVHQMVTIEVSPLNLNWDEPLLIVVFNIQENNNQVPNGKQNRDGSAHDKKIKKLSRELASAQSEMQFVIDSQESAYEELQVANEEIVSTNEEFQTLNEELETSKEELESTNEELITTNQELKVQNELLAESYSFSQTIINTIHEPMIILDRHLNVKSANPSFYKKYRVTQQQTEGMPLFELGNKQWDIPELRRLLENIISKNSQFENFEVTHSFPGLGEKVMLLNASRIVQKTHREKLILLAVEDITERTLAYKQEKEILNLNIKGHKANNAQLEKAVELRTSQLHNKNAELALINKDLKSFSYVSGHDLQEPLRKIQNLVSCLLDEEKKNLSATGVLYLNNAYETAQRMRTLINDLLSYTSTRDIEKNFIEQDLAAIFREIFIETGKVIPKKRITLKISGLHGLMMLHTQFKELFIHLLKNSVKFSAPHRILKVKITCKRVPGKDVAGEGIDPTIDYCHIVYSDNGIGFEPKYNERIFGVFQRLNSYEKYKGSGIGLAICRKITSNHNGSITASGTLNKGASFDIYFPMTQEKNFKNN